MSEPTPPSATEYLLASMTERDRLYLQFDHFADKFRKAFARLLKLAEVDAAAPWRGLDVACGEGLYAANLCESHPKATVVGFDRDAEAIATARVAFRGCDRLSFHSLDAHAPLAVVVGEGFDVAFIECGLTHFRDGLLALRGVYEVLRPGGAVMLLDPMERGFDYPHPSSAPLTKAFLSAWRSYGTYGAGERQASLLAEAGFVQIAAEPQDFQFGGPTPDGQSRFLLFIELFHSMRNALVERTRSISATEFDGHVAKLLETRGQFEGTYYFRRAFARKPL